MVKPDVFDPEILPGALDVPANWGKVFGRNAPLEVEIGSGGGRYLIACAEARPESNFLAIETDGEYFYLLKERAAKRRLSNLRVCRNDATDLVASVFPDACVDCFHIYFPDPWPKKRHLKRRIFTAAFCSQLRRTLKPRGVLYLATDYRDYVLKILPVLAAKFEVDEHVGTWEDAPKGRTNFEIKYIKEGRPIWRYVARCKNSESL